MKLSDFDFDLPNELIALRPAVPRTASRLLVSEPSMSGFKDHVFSDLTRLLKKGDRLVINNTKVIPAALKGERIRQSDMGETRAAIQVNLLAPLDGKRWQALAKPAKRVNIGEEIAFSKQLSAIVEDKSPDGLILAFNLIAEAFDHALAEIGRMPLPPYIEAQRPADHQDHDDYQTIFAKHQGAVAAPTASLHFDDALFGELKRIGVDISYVTLHVGAGTFLPVKVDDIKTHKMHAEWGEITARAADEINQTKDEGGRVIPVGTTALRLLESASRSGRCKAWLGETDIFITPGFEFQMTDGLITNFHLPKSTLLMLVSALMGLTHMRELYEHAIENSYRFFSYGDSSLLIP